MRLLVPATRWWSCIVIGLLLAVIRNGSTSAAADQPEAVHVMRCEYTSARAGMDNGRPYELPNKGYLRADVEFHWFATGALVMRVINPSGGRDLETTLTVIWTEGRGYQFIASDNIANIYAINFQRAEASETLIGLHEMRVSVEWMRCRRFD